MSITSAHLSQLIASQSPLVSNTSPSKAESEAPIPTDLDPRSQILSAENIQKKSINRSNFKTLHDITAANNIPDIVKKLPVAITDKDRKEKLKDLYEKYEYGVEKLKDGSEISTAKLKQEQKEKTLAKVIEDDYGALKRDRLTQEVDEPELGFDVSEAENNEPVSGSKGQNVLKLSASKDLGQDIEIKTNRADDKAYKSAGTIRGIFSKVVTIGAVAGAAALFLLTSAVTVPIAIAAAGIFLGVSLAKSAGNVRRSEFNKLQAVERENAKEASKSLADAIKTHMREAGGDNKLAGKNIEDRIRAQTLDGFIKLAQNNDRDGLEKLIKQEFKRNGMSLLSEGTKDSIGGWLKRGVKHDAARETRRIWVSELTQGVMRGFAEAHVEALLVELKTEILNVKRNEHAGVVTDRISKFEGQLITTLNHGLKNLDLGRKDALTRALVDIKNLREDFKNTIEPDINDAIETCLANVDQSEDRGLDTTILALKNIPKHYGEDLDTRLDSIQAVKELAFGKEIDDDDSVEFVDEKSLSAIQQKIQDFQNSDDLTPNGIEKFRSEAMGLLGELEARVNDENDEVAKFLMKEHADKLLDQTRKTREELKAAVELANLCSSSIQLFKGDVLTFDRIERKINDITSKLPASGQSTKLTTSAQKLIRDAKHILDYCRENTRQTQDKLAEWTIRAASSPQELKKITDEICLYEFDHRQAALDQSTRDWKGQGFTMPSSGGSDITREQALRKVIGQTLGVNDGEFQGLIEQLGKSHQSHLAVDIFRNSSDMKGLLSALNSKISDPHAVLQIVKTKVSTTEEQFKLFSGLFPDSDLLNAVNWRVEMAESAFVKEYQSKLSANVGNDKSGAVASRPIALKTSESNPEYVQVQSLFTDLNTLINDLRVNKGKSAVHEQRVDAVLKSLYAGGIKGDSENFEVFKKNILSKNHKTWDFFVAKTLISYRMTEGRFGTEMRVAEIEPQDIVKEIMGLGGKKDSHEINDNNKFLVAEYVAIEGDLRDKYHTERRNGIDKNNHLHERMQSAATKKRGDNEISGREGTIYASLSYHFEQSFYQALADIRQGATTTANVRDWITGADTEAHQSFEFQKGSKDLVLNIDFPKLQLKFDANIDRQIEGWENLRNEMMGSVNNREIEEFFSGKISELRLEKGTFKKYLAEAAKAGIVGTKDNHKGGGLKGLPYEKMSLHAHIGRMYERSAEPDVGALIAREFQRRALDDNLKNFNVQKMEIDSKFFAFLRSLGVIPHKLKLQTGELARISKDVRGLCNDLGQLGKLNVDMKAGEEKIDGLVGKRNQFFEGKDLKRASREINAVLDKHAKNAGERDIIYPLTREGIRADLSRILPIESVPEVKYAMDQSTDIHSLRQAINRYLELRST